MTDPRAGRLRSGVRAVDKLACDSEVMDGREGGHHLATGPDHKKTVM
jgi:hypothetical protein